MIYLLFDTQPLAEAAEEKVRANARLLLLGAGYVIDAEGRAQGKRADSGADNPAALTERWAEPELVTSGDHAGLWGFPKPEFDILQGITANAEAEIEPWETDAIDPK